MLAALVWAPGAQSAASEAVPPIVVRSVEGAPPSWDLHGRVALALRKQRLTAHATTEVRHGYILSGRIRFPNDRQGDVLISWTLVDPRGREIAALTQLATLPAAGQPAEPMLDLLAESLAGGVTGAVPAARLAQGQARSRPLARAPVPPSPRIETLEPAAGTAGPARATPGRRAFWVQVGAFPKETAARAWFLRLRQRNAGILGDVPYIVVPTDLGEPRGTWYRVRVGPFPDAGAADRMCGELKAADVDCFIGKTG